MPLRLHDTLSDAIRPVRARPGHPVTLYVCGPTVYAPPHVGHARTYLEFDLVRRALEADGRRVRHVMNITDFEDKIDVRAAQLGLTWRALARREERRFDRALRALGVLPPHVEPRASEFVAPMIEVGRRLERTGRVRRDGDSWIYTPPERPRGANFVQWADLADHAVEERTHPFPTGPGVASEFVLWKRQGPPRPSWPSPWGRGSPGWHLECYAMARRYLGIPTGVCGGGRDLIFPHHFAGNEIALALDRRPFARLFVHTGFVLQNGRKMSKSTGNLTSVAEALELASAAALRWYLVRRPYSERVEWDVRELGRSAATLDRIRRTVRRWLGRGAGGRRGATDARALAAGVRADLAANLATHRALHRIERWTEGLARDATGRVARGEAPAARRAFAEVEARLGLPLT